MLVLTLTHVGIMQDRNQDCSLREIPVGWTNLIPNSIGRQPLIGAGRYTPSKEEWKMNLKIEEAQVQEGREYCKKEEKRTKEREISVGSIEKWFLSFGFNVFVVSLLLGIYKNFTAIDRHTLTHDLESGL